MSASDSDNLSQLNESVQKPREDLIDIAVKFLQNPKILPSPLEFKQKFLKSKGLTDEEISIAVSRSSPALPALQTSIAIPPQQALLPQQSFWSKFRDIGNSLALLGGILYGVYLFYKKFIHPFLFGKKKKKSVEDSLTELGESLNVKVKSVQDDIKRVNTELAHLNSVMHTADTATRNIYDLKSEISSIKSILLSGSQFPAPKSSALSPTAIPAWQLAPKKEETTTQPTTDTPADEASGSGSGSSDPEMINNNGSDSSLELIRE